MTDQQQTTGVAITEDEAALYDRQIRLWGIEAQERMRNATIMIINLKGIAAETVKNIVLAGIGSLHLYDSEDVTEEDLGAGFLFREEDVGKKRVDAARPKIEALNPLVTVKAFSDPNLLSDLELPNALTGVSLVCVTDSTRDELIRFNDACRKKSVLFYAGGTYGLLGYIFVDLLSHQHLAPDRKEKVAPGSQPKMVKHTATYVRLSDALGSLRQTFSAMNRMQTKEANPAAFFSILAIWEYQSRHQGALPSGPQSTEDLETIANELIKSANVNSKILSTIPKPTVEMVAQTAAHEFSPTCAVVGGLLAQDILKALAGREPPYANLLTFDGATGSGNVVRLGLS